MKKRIISMLLATTLCGAALTACSGSDAGSSESAAESKEETTVETAAAAEDSAAVEAEANEDITLTVWVPDSMRIEDWNTNDMTLWFEEQLGYDLEIVPLSSEDYITKVNMSLTAGNIEDLPDVIMGTFGGSTAFNDSYVWSWAQAETIVPLTEYYENPELTVNIQEAIERTGVDYTQQIVSPDGNIYGVASYNQSYGNEYVDKLWIYEPWLNELGLEVPKTVEEFYEVLKQVCATDLNGNGKKDEIGMLGSNDTYANYIKVIMNAFVYSGDPQYRTVEDGVVSAAYTTEEWKESLKFLKKMFDEGLIAPESLTMTDDQYDTLYYSETPMVFSFVQASPGMVTSETREGDEYTAIDTLTGPNGVNYASYTPSVANTTMVVTANCENPEAAFRLGDLMSCEYIGISQRWGEEGIDWDYVKNMEDSSKYKASVDGFEMSIFTYDDAEFWSGTEATNRSWRQTGPYIRQYGIANGWAMEADGGDNFTRKTNAAMTLYQTSGHAPEEVIPKLIYTEDETEIVSEVESVLKSYVDECLASFVTGTKDIDAEWDNYLAELEKIGLGEYLEVVQGVYDRMYK